MGTMLDTTRPAELPDPLPAGVALAGYIDGAESAWPPEDFGRYTAAGVEVLKTSVLADPAAVCFDGEKGNAGPDEIAGAIRTRYDREEPSVLYCSRLNVGPYMGALRARGLPTFTPPELWPHLGVYWWDADWTGAQHLTAGAVATQWTNGNPYDTSETYGSFPASEVPEPAPEPEPPAPSPEPQPEPGPAPTPPEPPAPPAPGPTPPQEVDVQLPVLHEGISHSAVRPVQILVNAAGVTAGLAVDGVFGPKTDAAVREYQAHHGLNVDGVVGAHTWGSLCGAPQ